MLPNIRENFTKAQFKLEFACDEPKCCQIVACKSSTSELKKKWIWVKFTVSVNFDRQIEQQKAMFIHT